MAVLYRNEVSVHSFIYGPIIFIIKNCIQWYIWKFFNDTIAWSRDAILIFFVNHADHWYVIALWIIATISDYSVQNVTISFPVNLCTVTILVITFSVPCSGSLPPTVVTVSTTSVNNWMVIHQNLNSSFSWNRPWASYKSGFGSSSSDYWMGLAVLSQMTATQNYRLDETNLKNSFRKNHLLHPLSKIPSTYSW